MRGFLAGTGAPLLARGLMDLDDKVDLPKELAPTEVSLVFKPPLGFAAGGDSDFLRVSCLPADLGLWGLVEAGGVVEGAAVFEATFRDAFFAAFIGAFLTPGEATVIDDTDFLDTGLEPLLACS